MPARPTISRWSGSRCFVLSTLAVIMYAAVSWLESVLRKGVTAIDRNTSQQEGVAWTGANSSAPPRRPARRWSPGPTSRAPRQARAAGRRAGAFDRLSADVHRHGEGLFRRSDINVKIVTIETGAGHTNAVLSGPGLRLHRRAGALRLRQGQGRRAARRRALRRSRQRLFLRRQGPRADRTRDWPAYFKGKAIATGGFGGTPNSITRYLLKKWNLDAKKRRHPDRDRRTRRSSPRSGASRPQIGCSTEPFITQGVQQWHLGRAVLQRAEGARPLRLFHHQHPSRTRSRRSRRWCAASCAA